MEDIRNHKCPGCGSPLRFDAGAQSLVCDACGSHFDISTVEQYDEAADGIDGGDTSSWETYGGVPWEDGVAVHVCPSCGAEIVTDPTTAVTKCPYCDNVTVIEGNLSGVLRPDCVIPFSVTAEDARRLMAEYCRNKPLLPKNFINELHIEETQGLYIPFWLFDCRADGRATYLATKVRHWSDRKYDYTETRRFRVYRRGGMAFSKIPADGSRKADDTMMESIEPYDYRGMKEFGTGYLSGFVADKYDVGADESKARADARVKNSIEAALLTTVIGYSSVIPTGSSVKITDGTVRYAMLPVWLLHYTYRGERFTYAINGQTGRVVGKLPISRGRAAAWFAGIYAAAAALVALIMFLL